MFIKLPMNVNLSSECVIVGEAKHRDEYDSKKVFQSAEAMAYVLYHADSISFPLLVQLLQEYVYLWNKYHYHEKTAAMKTEWKQAAKKFEVN